MNAKEFYLPSTPNFTRYLKNNFGGDITLGDFSDTIREGTLIIPTRNHTKRIGPHSLEIIILLNNIEIGKFKRFVAAEGGKTVLGYSGRMPCYYNKRTKDNLVSLSAYYEGEYPLWIDLATLDKKLLTRNDAHSIPFP